jgi:TatD DNase family protein
MQISPLIDAHCHLDFEVFDTDREDVLQRAIKNNITDIIIPGTEKAYWNRVRLLCIDNQHLHACYGIHPYWLNRHSKQDVPALETYIENYRPVALGECGLDFRPQQADRETQLYFFEAQLEIAHSKQLPVVIHSVRATEIVIQSIKKFSGLRGMIHSFSGSSQQAKQLIDLNFLISISASVTYDNAKKIQSVAEKIPLNALLLETDAPDQPSQNNVGKRNEPAFLVDTLNKISELRNEPVEIIAAQTTKNAKILFNIK